MKKRSVLFLFLCLALCLTPLLGMLVRPTTVSTENRTLSAFPSLRTEDGGPNLGFFPAFEQYFNEHFAFRNELVYADSRLMGEVFGVSGVKSVIYGTDGWLYYASSLNDYLGLRRMSERELFNTAHNLSLAARFVQQRGARFLLAIAPNKNTLYGEHMPAYDAFIVDPEHDADRLAPLLRELGVPEADLFGLFRAEDEILYLKRDSHWNGRGALLAYRRLMEGLGLPYDDYAGVPASRALDNDGDLNRMLYTLYGKKSADYHYEIPQLFSYAAPGASVEDGRIETSGGAGSASLLMFRDSFGNTLIPLLANQFERACFSKETPCGLEALMDACAPDAVIVEKVERNLSEYITQPPVFSAPEAQLPEAAPIEGAPLPVRVAAADSDSAYLRISGELPEELVGVRTLIYLRVDGVCYETCHLGENGFTACFKKDRMPGGPGEIEILLRDGELLRALRAAPEGTP